MRLFVVAGIGLLLVGCVIVRGGRDDDDRVEDGDDRPGTRPRPDTDTDVSAETDVEDDTDVADACEGRAGGALVTLQVDGERFMLWSFDEDFIDGAVAARQGDEVGTPVFGAVLAGADCDTSYDWHVDLVGMSWEQDPEEACDGAPSVISADLDARLGGAWCPAGASVVSVDDRR